jgi:hypothetical protein
VGWLREVESFPGMYGSPWSGNGKPVIGASVRAHVCKILPKKMALEHFPGDDGTAILEGVVMDNTDARGLSIEWKLPNDSVFRRNNAQRILLRAVGEGPPIFGVQTPPDPTSSALLMGTEAVLCAKPGTELVDPHPDDLEDEMAVPLELSPQEDPSYGEQTQEGLKPHGQLWREADDGVAIDTRTQQQWRPHLLWLGDARRIGGHSRLDTFLLMFPDLLETAVASFNCTCSPETQPLTVGELLKFIGLCFALGLVNLRRRREFWADPKNQDSWRIFPSPDFGRFGMGCRRFEAIMGGLKWYPLGDDNFPASDPWQCIRYFVFKFNERRGHKHHKTFQAGWSLCVDESTIKWRGEDGAWNTNGCPHVSKIARKPETLSIEIRDLLCTQSGIFLALEIMEGKEAMSGKAHVREHGAGTA